MSDYEILTVAREENASVLRRADPAGLIREAASAAGAMMAENAGEFADGVLTAEKSYAAGEYFTAGNALYRMTADVPAGGLIRLGTNAVPTTAGAEIRESFSETAEVRDDFAAYRDAISTPVEPVNRFDAAAWTAGMVSPETGEVLASAEYAYGPAMKVRAGDVIRGYVYSAASGAIVSSAFRFAAVFDKEGRILPEKGADGAAAMENGFVVPDGADTVVLTWQLAVGENYRNMLTVNAVPAEYSEYFAPYYRIHAAEEVRAEAAAAMAAANRAEDGVAQAGTRIGDNTRRIGEVRAAFEAFADGITDRGEPVNRFHAEDWTPGMVSASTGAVTASETYHYSPPIPVSAGDVIRGYVYSRNSGALVASGFRFAAAFGEDDSILPDKGASGASSTADGYTVPAGVASVVLTWQLAVGENYRNMLTVNEVPTEYSDWFEPYAVLYAEEKADAAQARAEEAVVLAESASALANRTADKTASLGDQFDSFVEGAARLVKPVNLFRAEDWKPGMVNVTTGAVTASDTYHYSVPIKVEEGDVVRGYSYSRSSGTLLNSGFRFVAAYDRDGGILSGKGASGSAATANGYTVPAGVASVVLTWQLAAGENYRNMLTVNEVPAAYSDWFEPYYEASPAFLGSSFRERIDIRAEEGIAAFCAKMRAAFEAGNRDVYVHPGDYVYTDAAVDGLLAEGKRGVPVGGNCRYFFAAGARVLCEYGGENTADAASLFSPLDTWNRAESFEIHGLDLTAKNTVYAFHDEADGGSAPIRHLFKNCRIALDNTALGGNGQAISKALGGGLGKYEEVALENCVFRAVNPAKTSVQQDDASYHAANGSSVTDARITVSGCRFEGRFRTSDVAGTVSEAPYPRVVYCGNSSGAAAVFPESWDVLAWNNEVRA